jgi:hypothetical protein
VDNLCFNGDILNSFVNLLNWLFNHNGLFDFSSNVLNLSFYGIIISNGPFNGNSFVSNDFFIFNDFSLNWDLVNFLDLFILNIFLFEWNIFDSALNGDLFSNCFVNSASNGISLVDSSISLVSSISSDKGVGIVGSSLDGSSSCVISSGLGSSCSCVDLLCCLVISSWLGGIDIAGGGVTNNWGVCGGGFMDK